MLRRSYKLNLNLWGGLIALTFLAAGAGLGTSILAVERLAENVTAGIQSSRQVAAYNRQANEELKRLEHKSDLNRARVDAIKDHTQAITVGNYICDRNNPPILDDADIWARPDVLVDVLDRNQVSVGFIDSDGRFRFDPQC